MPSSDSLFRAAIMESNPMGVVYRTPSQAQGDGDGYIEKLCRAAGGGLQCDVAITARGWFNRSAQSLTTLQVLQAQASFDGPRPAVERIASGGLEQGLPWTPTVDGQVVRGQPLLGYASGMRRKPYVFGFNRDEGVIFAAFGDTIITATEYNLLLDRIFKLGAGTVRNYVAADGDTAYNAASADSVAGMATPASALANLITDMAFKCANLLAADSGYAANQRAGTSTAAAPPVFGYLFQRSPIPFTMYRNTEECSAESGMVCHANELPYVFNTLSWADTAYASTALQAPDTSLARQMASAWGNFAKRPTQSPVSGWTPYTTNGSVYSWSGTSNGPMVTNVASTANCTQLWFNQFPLKPGSVSTADAGPASTAPPGTLPRTGR
jgi:para-nitrobenzyl esterase